MSRVTELTGAPPCMGSTRRWCVRPTSGRCWDLSPPPTLRACGWCGHLPCPRHGQPWGASLGAPSPLLAQEVLELVHQLLRVEGVVTRWARRLVRRRVIVLLSLPHIGLGGSILGHRLVALGPKDLHGRIEGE